MTNHQWTGPTKADEGWSEWIEWSGELPDIDGKILVEWHSNDGRQDECEFEELHFGSPGELMAIKKYRYRLDDNAMTPESDMHPDLEWLARNVSEWPDNAYWGAWLTSREGSKEATGFHGWPKSLPPKYHTAYARSEWLQARKDLGLIMSDEEMEMPVEEWNSGDTVPTSIKQLRYQDAKGEDWIDEFARTASADEFRGAMKFTIGKYNRRAGKKDELIKEIEKMRDYCDRWIEYERTL